MVHSRPCARTEGFAAVAAAAGASVLLIPGTGSTGHLREILVAEHVALDDQALRELAGVGTWPS